MINELVRYMVKATIVAILIVGLVCFALGAYFL